MYKCQASWTKHISWPGRTWRHPGDSFSGKGPLWVSGELGSPWRTMELVPTSLSLFSSSWHMVRWRRGHACVDGAMTVTFSYHRTSCTLLTEVSGIWTLKVVISLLTSHHHGISSSWEWVQRKVKDLPWPLLLFSGHKAHFYFQQIGRNTLIPLSCGLSFP